MALTSPSDPAASFLLLLLLLLIFCRCFSIKQLTPARPAAHPRPAAPGETPPPARRAGQGGGSGLHLLHSAGAGFQSPPDPGGKRGRAAARPQCLLSAAGGGSRGRRPSSVGHGPGSAGPAGLSRRRCLQSGTRSGPTLGSELPFDLHRFYPNLIFFPNFSPNFGLPKSPPFTALREPEPAALPTSRSRAGPLGGARPEPPRSEPCPSWDKSCSDSAGASQAAVLEDSVHRFWRAGGAAVVPRFRHGMTLLFPTGSGTGAALPSSGNPLRG